MGTAITVGMVLTAVGIGLGLVAILGVFVFLISIFSSGWKY